MAIFHKLPLFSLDKARLKAGGPAGQKKLASFITALTLTAGLLSFAALALYPLPEPTMSNGRLGVFFNQYNPDSPAFYYSALRFPKFYKENSERASRPLTALLVKPASLFLKTLLKHISPHSRLLTVHWGGYSVLENCTVYFGWIVLNIAFFGFFLRFCAELFSAYFHVKDVKTFLVMLTFTAPVVLTLTWLHTTVIGWLITALTLCLVRRLASGQSFTSHAMFLGLLLLGKPYISVFIISAVCLFDRARVKRWLFAAALIFCPTVMWRIFCLWYGIDASGVELLMVQSLPHYLTPEAFPRTVWGFITQNFIGLCILANPLMVFFVIRGLVRPLWRFKPFFIIFLVFIFDLSAHFIQQRTGSVYMYNYFYAGIPLFMAGIIKNGKTMNPDTIILSNPLKCWLIGTQLIWLCGALFFQLSLWRNGQWF